MGIHRYSSKLVIAAIVLLFAFGPIACGGGGGGTGPPEPDSLLGFASGGELYLSDGSNPSYRVSTSNPTGTGSNIRDLVVLGDLILFQGTDAASDSELWSYSPVSGAQRVADIHTTGSSNPRYMTAIGGHVYFQANDGFRGTELWMTNGTSLGTTLVSDINGGSGGSNPRDIAGYHGRVYFKAAPAGIDYLFAYSGSGSAFLVTTATYPSGIRDPSTPTASEALDLLFFRMDDRIFYDYQASAFNGTEVTLLVTNEVNYNSRAACFTEYNGKVYFSADDGIRGQELWVTNGTDTGTTLFADLYPGGAGSHGNPTELTVYNGALFFSAREELDNLEIFSFAGTDTPTMVQEINPGGSSFPKNFREYQGLLYFQADDGWRGSELWATDGTAGGTTIGDDIDVGAPSSTPEDLVVVPVSP